jgi:hypothetical protein
MSKSAIKTGPFLPVVIFAVALSLPSAILGQDSKPLQAGVTRSVSLAPLDSALAPGNVFDKSKAEALIGQSKSSNNWHKVPAWYPGTCKSDQMVFTFRRDEESGQEDRSSHAENRHSSYTVDACPDTTGQMWEYDPQGFWIEGQGDDDLHYNWMMARSVTIATDKEVAHKGQAVGFHVDKRSNIIKSCDRNVSETSTFPVSSTAIRSRTFQRTFDWQGTHRGTAEFACKYKKTREDSIDPNRMTRDGKPLYPLFVQFLKDNNMADRIPDAQPAP